MIREVFRVASEARVNSDVVELAGFLDRAFDGVAGISAEYPTLLGSGQSLVVHDAGRIVAHAAWRSMRLRSAGREIVGAGIGLVTTDPDARGRGHASVLVDACVGAARDAGAALALLFAPSRSLYARQGFVPAGRERVTLLPEFAEAPDKRIRTGTPADAERLLPWLARQAVGVERSVEEFGQLLAVPGTRLFVLEDEDGPAAYCVEGKGHDLQGVVHEWAGEAEDVATLLRGVAGGRWLLAPACVPSPLAGEGSLGPLAQFRVLRPDLLGSADPVELFGDPQHPARLPLYVWGLDSI